MLECTFQPKIYSKGSMSGLKMQERAVRRQGADLLSRQKEWEERKLAKRLSLTEEVQLGALKECSFAPQLKKTWSHQPGQVRTAVAGGASAIPSTAKSNDAMETFLERQRRGAQQRERRSSYAEERIPQGPLPTT